MQWPSLVPPGIPGGQLEAGCAPGVLDGVVGVVPCLVPPGMPRGQMEAEWAPGVLDGIVVGVLPFARGKEFFAEGREAYGVLSCMLKN